MEAPIRVLMITSEWPTEKSPFAVPFLVQQVDFLRRAGADVDVFFFRGAKNPLNYVKAWCRLQWEYRSKWKQYDLIHAQFGQAALIPWPKKLPLVITFHGVDMLGQLSDTGQMTWRGKLLVWLGRLAARFADAVIIVSNEMRQNLPKSMTLHMLPTGVDLASLPELSKDEARRQLSLPADERLVLFVGNPKDPLKRYDRAREAIDALNRRLPVTLVLGWNMPHGDIIKMMHACDALIVTSLQEGSPTIVKEALACNLGIASVIVGDVVERLAGIEGCEVAADHAPETIAAALEKVLLHGGRVKGREAIQELDERVITDKLMRIYRGVTRHGRPTYQLSDRPFVSTERR
ncbi:glycosyltransferase family 4 protein [Microvirga terrae]|uniref:Glycosyltransferase family 4 protein n=1 Tax=Microvirga terrae TaxID=2740529 RepID=A0ABY5RL51_9HYPH|nr:glycosyltransferase family 4 protein [Microvirga terrae]UVF17594.1 glycosyltransferase family 4 protein [Microvirga terrae]